MSEVFKLPLSLSCSGSLLIHVSPVSAFVSQPVEQAVAILHLAGDRRPSVLALCAGDEPDGGGFSEDRQ